MIHITGKRTGKRERERKEKKSTQQRTHSVPGDGRAPFGECGSLCSLHFIAGCRRGSPGGDPVYTAPYASHIQGSTQLRVEPGIAKPGRRRSPKQPSIHGLCLGVCALFTRGYSNVLAHALQDSIVGSVSAYTPQLPRTAARLSCSALQLRCRVPRTVKTASCHGGGGASHNPYRPFYLLTCMKVLYTGTVERSTGTVERGNLGVPLSEPTILPWRACASPFLEPVYWAHTPCRDHGRMVVWAIGAVHPELGRTLDM